MSWPLNLFQSIVFQTVMSGVLVYVLSQIIEKFFLDPILKYNEVKGKIDNKLKFYSNVIANPGILPDETYLECSNILRELSCELEATYKQIPVKKILVIKLDSPENVSNSARLLIELSNNLYDPVR